MGIHQPLSMVVKFSHFEVLVSELDKQAARDAVVQEALSVLAQANGIDPICHLHYAPLPHRHLQ